MSFGMINEVGVITLPVFYVTQEQDKKMLEALIEREKEEREILTTRREKAQADARWMKQVKK